MRELRRLLLDPRRLAAGAGEGRLPLDSAEGHYLRRVLRLRAGQAFAVLDGEGQLWSAQLAEGPTAGEAWAVLDQPLDEPLLREPAPRPWLALAVAPPRRDCDVLLRMACELGIHRIQWLAAERSVVGEPIRPDRQTALLREALEQCERLWLPVCPAPQPALAWLGSAPQGLRLLATTRLAGLPSLAAELRQAELQQAALQQASGPSSVTVAIGPEGGWSPAEQDAALAAGWRPVSLGPAILRTSTAAVAAASQLAAWGGEAPFSCGTSPRPSL